MSSLWVSQVSGVQEDEGNFKYKIKVMEEKTRGIVTGCWRPWNYGILGQINE